MKCKVRRHMTVSIFKGEETIIYNYRCIPHGVVRRAFVNRKAREASIEEHKRESRKK